MPRCFTLRFPAPAVTAWDPSQLASVAGWYDASDTSSITASSNQVSQWNDKSGNARHLVQATANNQPKSGTRTLNGLNVLDFFWGANPSWMDATGINISQPTTIYGVLRWDAVGSGGSNVVDGVTTRQAVGAQANGTGWLYYAGTVQNAGSAPGVTAHQFVAIFNGASSTLYIDGTSISTANPGAQGLNGFRVGTFSGASAAVDGIGAEFAVQNAVGSSTERTNWNTYCARWGL